MMTHPDVKHGKTGVLLVNLGTPPSLSYWDIRWYLKEFLEDPRVVEMNRFVWKTLLNGILLNFIPRRSRRNYAKIWNQEQNKSPLLVITEQQTKALKERFASDGSVVVDFAMRYGQPSIHSRIMDLKKHGCTQLVVMPLYPQYSAVTVASVCDAVFKALQKMRWVPALRVIPPYYDHPAYIQALAHSVRPYLSEKTTLLASYHGIPQRYFDAGDPYPCHCQKTTRLLREALNIPQERVVHGYQSRFGKDEWVKPYTDILFETLPQQGVTDLTVISPAFASDCVETLEELAISGKEEFMAAGGRQFSVVPCLNDQKNHIDMLEILVRENGHGWL